MPILFLFVFRDKKSIILPPGNWLRTLGVLGEHAACSFFPLPHLGPAQLFLGALDCSDKGHWAVDPCSVWPCAPGWWAGEGEVLLVCAPYFSSVWKKKPPEGWGTFSSPSASSLSLTQLSFLSTGKGQGGSEASNDKIWTKTWSKINALTFRWGQKQQGTLLHCWWNGVRVLRRLSGHTFYNWKHLPLQIGNPHFGVCLREAKASVCGSACAKSMHHLGCRSLETEWLPIDRETNQCNRQQMAFLET